MVKLISRGSVFIIVGMLILHGLAYVARTVAPDGTSYFLRIDQQQFEDVLDHRDEVEALVVGSSHGDDIDVSTLPQQAYQLSRAWGDFFEADYYLKYLVPRLSALHTVYLPVSYFSFYWDNAAAEKLSVRRAQMYSVVPNWWFIEGDMAQFVRGRGAQIFPVQSILREDNWQGVFYALTNGDDELEPPVGFEDICDYPPPDELAEIAESRALEAINIGQEIRANYSDIRTDAYRAAAEITRYLQARDIRVVFFTPPYYAEFTAEYLRNDPDALELLQTNMLRLQEEFGVEYYDFSADQAYIEDHQLFMDSDHLNSCGRRLFTKQLDERMKRAVAGR